MLTAKHTERDAVRARDAGAGASGFIIEPFEPQELPARLRRFLKTAGRRRHPAPGTAFERRYGTGPPA